MHHPAWRREPKPGYTLFLPPTCPDNQDHLCQSGETVRVAFAIDCCDREVIGFVASSGGISSGLVRDLMLE